MLFNLHRSEESMCFTFSKHCNIWAHWIPYFNIKYPNILFPPKIISGSGVKDRNYL